jgi:hypothetical protein
MLARGTNLRASQSKICTLDFIPSSGGRGVRSFRRLRPLGKTHVKTPRRKAGKVRILKSQWNRPLPRRKQRRCHKLKMQTFLPGNGSRNQAWPRIDVRGWLALNAQKRRRRRCALPALLPPPDITLFWFQNPPIQDGNNWVLAFGYTLSATPTPPPQIELWSDYGGSMVPVAVSDGISPPQLVVPNSAVCTGFWVKARCLGLNSQHGEFSADLQINGGILP